MLKTNEVETLIRAREMAKGFGDYEGVTRIEEKLLDNGFGFVDTPHGVKWRRIDETPQINR